MAKLFALTKIIMPHPKTGEDLLISKNSVFDASPAQAKQFDGLKVARPATDAEIAAAKEAEAKADGTAFLAPAPSDDVVDEKPVVETPGSTASGDPKSVPKGKSA